MAWTMTTLTFSDISEVKSTNLGLDEEEIVRIKVSFAYSGNAFFYTYGDGDDDAGHAYDPYGYLCLSAEDINKTYGEPDGDIEVEDDDGGDGYNFRIEYYVEAQKSYYLYVRHRAASSYGTIHLTIEPPDEPEVYEPNMDDIYIQQRSSDNPSTEITVRLRGLDEKYSEDDWSLLWYIHDPSLSMATLLETIGPKYVSPGDDRSDTVTFTGLSPGKTYYIECRIQYYVDGKRKTHWVYSDSPDADGDFTTNESVTIDGAYVEFGSNTGTTITVSVKGLDTSYSRNDRYIYWSIDGVEKSPVSLSSGVPQSNSYTFTGLSPSTSYTIGARITYTSNGSTFSKELEDIFCSTANWASEQQSGLGTVYTTKTASWTLRKATIFYASVKFSQSGNVTISSSGSYDTYGYLTTGTPSFNNSSGVPNNYVANNDDDGDGSNFSLTYAVETGVTYYIWVRGHSVSTSVGTITLNVSFSNRPELFTWGDGSTVKTSGKEFDITASEWCALLDNINAVRKYKGESEFTQNSYTLSDYYNYFTYPVSGQTFRYQHYNQALNAITGMLGTGYNANAVKKGDPVTAAKINLLVEWLNGIT